MALFGLVPDFFGDELSHQLEKDVLKAVFSATMSATIAFLWSSRLSRWLGLKDMATTMWLSLQQQVQQGKMNLAVDKTLLSSDNLARFETEFKQ